MELILDIVIIILIAIMIGYSVVLNIKLKVFRSAQNEMANLIGQLNEAVSRSQASVETLKKAAITEEARLKDIIIKARLLADELEIITQSGSNLADRIEQGLVPAHNIQYDEAPDQEDDIEEYEEDNEMLETLKKIR